MLIKPTREHSDPFSVYILYDGMKLFSLKINATEYINYYADNTFKSKFSIETQYNLNLEDKVKNLKLSNEE